jgi:HEPN domain-containing protein
MLESVPAAEWETLTPDQKRRAGILAKWTVEKLLQAMVIAQGKQPSSTDLESLYRQAGAELLPKHEESLLSLIPRISANETDDFAAQADYEKAYWLAVMLKEYVHNCLAIMSLQEEKRRRAPAAQ